MVCNLEHYSINGSINDQTTFDHLNTELVCYSDPHCMNVPLMFQVQFLFRSRTNASRIRRLRRWTMPSSEPWSSCTRCRGSGWTTAHSWSCNVGSREQDESWIEPSEPYPSPSMKEFGQFTLLLSRWKFQSFFFLMWTLLIGENLFSDHLLWSIFQSLLFKLLWGLKYPIFQFKTDSKSKFFEVWIWNGRIGMVLLILYSIGSHM